MRKKQGLAKGILALILVVILAALSVGFWLTKDRRQQKNEPQTVPVETTEPATEAPAPVETTEVPTTAAPQKDTLFPKPQNGKPVLVDPNGENWSLTPVNLHYQVDKAYKPSLKPAIDGSAVQLDARVAPFYAQMYAAAKADGCTLTPYSGYRNFARQQENFDRKKQAYLAQGATEEEAILKTQRLILPAGASEHNLGFSMDIVSASADFVATKEFKWLQAHAYEFGFILRYPQDKTELTGVAYEPWHWRYVGVKAAKEMQENNLCLEEYLGMA